MVVSSKSDYGHNSLVPIVATKVLIVKQPEEHLGIVQDGCSIMVSSLRVIIIVVLWYSVVTKLAILKPPEHQGIVG